jgi:hypothetical protein
MFFESIQMHKKNIHFVLIPALLIQLCGCYSMQDISKDEMSGLKLGGDLIVHSRDSTIYFFEQSNYQISNDSLYGKGYVKYPNAYDFKAVNKSTVALANIETMQQDELNQVKTWLLIGGISLAVIVVIVLVF